MLRVGLAAYAPVWDWEYADSTPNRQPLRVASDAPEGSRDDLSVKGSAWTRSRWARVVADTHLRPRTRRCTRSSNRPPRPPDTRALQARGSAAGSTRGARATVLVRGSGVDRRTWFRHFRWRVVLRNRRRSQVRHHRPAGRRPTTPAVSDSSAGSAKAEGDVVACGFRVVDVGNLAGGTNIRARTAGDREMPRFG